MKHNWKVNLLFTLIVLALAAGLLIWQRAGAKPGPIARLTCSDGRTVDIPLNKDERYDIESGGYTIHLQVTDGRIAFVDSPCPDHLCEGFGWLENSGDWAACMPAQALMHVEETAG